MANSVTVRGLSESDLAEADRIMRLAFGTFLGLPDPMGFMGDADYVRTRFAAEPAVALAAEVDGRLAGTNFVTRWGSVGFFGPLTVDPARWDSGVARALLDETMRIFDRWEVTHAGLFTFGQSPKHVSLYQKYGFLPRFLTPVLARPVTEAGEGADGEGRAGPAWLSAAEATDAEMVKAGCAAVTDAIYPGLEIGREIDAVLSQKLGDVVVVPGAGSSVDAFAVCHAGAGSEAGTGTCYVKFGAALPGPGADERFERLLGACEDFARRQQAQAVVAGVNSSRRGAYRTLLTRGYQPQLIGVTMHRPDESAYHDDSAWVIDDWR
ncbi:MAG TPA: GNAT family N-acetyltransferase [Acidimicrobiia bacterium]|nr:GNAT family N-acetyltransferase [Acidimicrobiia bacterium]